ncbi:MULTISPECIES: hypothetical protein [unclassified Bacillus (in: firmicutes)]|uniref:hypothetical protein n=1 Tax=unclassified Bacillus (in: firmicutes) TaxID=185979 RepID=UPI0008F1ADD6|nr:MULTISPECIES: hypothetical protein [unclassified Bacillus (in: firmicutes)]SFA86006.1 hypothetical protein SAMN02799634_10281 [Bacillus sp. UNCCL13]SFQ83563.1 hypothetical protein SAMN04488577_2200 [Bacillus sp. cl95]
MLGKKFLVIFLILVWLFYAIGFALFGILGFVAEASEQGFRRTLCGIEDCSTAGFIYSVAWLCGMIIVIYVLPPILAILYFRKRKKNR